MSDHPQEPSGSTDTGGESAPQTEAALIKELVAEQRGDGGETQETTETTEETVSEGTTETAEATETAEEVAAAPTIDVTALTASVASKDGPAILELLGLTPEDIGVPPGQFKANRHERRRIAELEEKASKSESKAVELATKLEDTYGDPIKVRKEVDAGNLDALADHLEKLSGMSWNELTRAMLAQAQGKSNPDMATKRKLKEYEQKELARAKEVEGRASEDKAAGEAKKAREWIANKLDGEPMMKHPRVVDLVFSKMREGYANGLRDPKEALKLVRTDLIGELKYMKAAGLLTSSPAKAPLSKGPPREGALTGSSGNSKPMSEKETREALLLEFGHRVLR